MPHDHDLIAKDELAKTAAQKRWARRRREKARRRGEAMEERLVQSGDLKPGGVARTAALVFGLAVHGLTLAVLAGVVAALLSGIWLLYIPAALGAAIVWVVRPRIGERPGAAWQTRAKLPRLYEVLDRIVAATGAPTPKYVRFDGAFNASTARRGLRHEPVLTIGAPLWQILDGDERLALLGHELGHQVNGDTTQGLLVATARQSLRKWRILFYPTSGPRPVASRGAAGLAAWLLPVVLLPFYALMTGAELFSVWLQVHVSLRAEFLADDIAARTASTPAALALIREFDARGSVDAYVTRSRYQGRSRRKSVSDEDAMEMWIGLQDYLKTIPEHEYIRAARVSEYRGTQIDASHPAHYLRARLLKGRPPHTAAVTVSEDEWLGVDVELAAFMAEVGRKLLR
jgi:Zn-dependent protease with chaperone function